MHRAAGLYCGAAGGPHVLEGRFVHMHCHFITERVAFYAGLCPICCVLRTRAHILRTFSVRLRLYGWCAQSTLVYISESARTTCPSIYLQGRSVHSLTVMPIPMLRYTLPSCGVHKVIPSRRPSSQSLAYLPHMALFITKRGLFMEPLLA